VVVTLTRDLAREGNLRPCIRRSAGAGCAKQQQADPQHRAREKQLGAPVFLHYSTSPMMPGSADADHYVFWSAFSCIRESHSRNSLGGSTSKGQCGVCVYCGSQTNVNFVNRNKHTHLLQYVGARTRAHTCALAQLQSSTQLRPALMVLAMQASAAGANGGTVCIMLT
jgi:hypothetical protein